jgi:hypothetical protein
MCSADVDDVDVIQNPIYEGFPDVPEDFFIVAGFMTHDFDLLSETVATVLAPPRRGRKQDIAPPDGFLMFLLWLHSAKLIDAISCFPTQPGHVPDCARNTFE